MSRDINPALLILLTAIIINVITAIFNLGNDAFFLVAFAGVAFGVIWTLPQAFKYRERR